MKIENIDTIEFTDKENGGNGTIIVRRYEDQVALCVSLENDGDIEVLFESEIATRLSDSISRAAKKEG